MVIKDWPAALRPTVTQTQADWIVGVTLTWVVSAASLPLLHLNGSGEQVAFPSIARLPRLASSTSSGSLKPIFLTLANHPDNCPKPDLRVVSLNT